MAAKVALTAEEFRENSQRSIALFNTEKLSTDSTHVLKSAYCNSVHFCRCNLHGACGGKVVWLESLNGIAVVAICTGRVEAKRSGTFLTCWTVRCNLHGACGGKGLVLRILIAFFELQSARGVWRQRSKTCPSACPVPVAICTGRVEAKAGLTVSCVLPLRCNLHGACGGKEIDFL